MTATKPHHLSMPVVDVLPCEVHCEISGGLVDLYADTNDTYLTRLRLTADTALTLYRQLGQRLSCLPIRLKDTDQ